MSVEITVTIIVTDQDDDPVEGIRVDLHCNGGFFGEDSTDDDGIVVFEDVRGWQTVDIWIDQENVGELGLDSSDVTYTHCLENEYKHHSSDNDDDEQINDDDENE